VTNEHSAPVQKGRGKGAGLAAPIPTQGDHHATLIQLSTERCIVPMVFIKRERVKWETHGEEAHRSVDRLEEIRKELAHLRSA
jgi:hypothetical protein